MASGITPTDLIFSTTSTEWHGAAKVRPVIGEDEIRLLDFPMIEQKLSMNVDGVSVELPNYKVIAADLRHRTDLAAEDRIPPLHVPKAGYRVITNREVYEQAMEVVNGLGMKIVTMGTLEGCKKFFLSIDTGGSNLTVKNRASGKMEVVLAFVDLINSHDGTMAQETYDSMTRIVCMNTLRWSREGKGTLGGKVFHTANADLAMKALGQKINGILSRRQEFVETMEALSEVTVAKEEALYLPVAFLAERSQAAENRIGARTARAAEDIQHLFGHGRGNVGKSAYDLFNGATEYWTSGVGTGVGTGVRKKTAAEKYYTSRHGAAADYKVDFLTFLGERDLEEETENGKRLYSDFQKATAKN